MQVWAVARQMISEGIRMKIALVFVLLILTVVIGLPFSVSGDDSVTGKVQSFLSYGFAATGVLLGMLTVFLSRSLSDDFVHRQILMVVTKPISRWQFIVGKWLGIVCLDAAFLSVAGLSIYGMTHFIKRNHEFIDRYDEAKLLDEVLVARHALRVRPPDFSKPAETEFQRNLEQGYYDNTPDFDPAREKASLVKKLDARWRVVGPRGMRIFEFENVLCDRSPDNRIYLRYKTEVSQYAPDEIFRSLWLIGNPLKGARDYQAKTKHVIRRYHTIAFPADAVAEDHTLTVRFFNENPFEGEPAYNNIIEFRKSDEIEVLFVVGSFEWNMIRLLMLTMCKLVFLAAVAVLMTTLFSFPVACLTSFTIYVLAGIRSFLEDALDFASHDQASIFASVKEFFGQSMMYLLAMIYWIVPDFGYYNAVEDLVNGRNVSLAWLLQGIGELVLLKSVIVLGLAILVFYRREVAEVSV